jgi:hypothetical protein
VHDVLVWIEGSALGQLMRQAGPLAYAAANVTHVFGVATLFGSILLLDLRLLGASGTRRHAPMASAVTPVAVTGFTVAAISGACLLATTATDYDGNPFLLIKFPAIALGLVNVFALRRSPSWQAGVSLACWVTAIAAGRLIAYW